ncbi:UNVERIFIED_ORG: hypothetical protein ABIC48_006244 [Burkholderia territorii]
MLWLSHRYHVAHGPLSTISLARVWFIHEGAKNVWHVFDVSGQYVGIEEAPLETPLVDPYDLVLIGSAALKLICTGFNTVSRLTTGRAAVSATSKMTSRILPLLRSKLQGMPVRRLQFTETTAKHMANPGRFVPVHILHLAIKYGRRMPDPQKVAGVFRYEIEMSRFVKRGTIFIRERKTLEVVVRENDWTILHFMYY